MAITDAAQAGDFAVVEPYTWKLGGRRWQVSAFPRVIVERAADARHDLERYPNIVVEADYGRLKAQLPPMRGRKQIRSLAIIAAGCAFVHNLRRGHHVLATNHGPRGRLAAAFAEVAQCL